jgi:hypothetical protein
MKFSREVMPLKTPDTIIFNTMASTFFKMAEVQISEMAALPEPVSRRLSRIKFCNHDNQPIVVSQFKAYTFAKTGLTV